MTPESCLELFYGFLFFSFFFFFFQVLKQVPIYYSNLNKKWKTKIVLSFVSHMSGITCQLMKKKVKIKTFISGQKRENEPIIDT